MKKQTEAEIHVLDRVMYLLEERSVSAAAQNNVAFLEYVENLYASVASKATALRNHTA